MFLLQEKYVLLLILYGFNIWRWRKYPCRSPLFYLVQFINAHRAFLLASTRSGILRGLHVVAPWIQLGQPVSPGLWQPQLTIPEAYSNKKLHPTLLCGVVCTAHVDIGFDAFLIFKTITIVHLWIIYPKVNTSSLFQLGQTIANSLWFPTKFDIRIQVIVTS